MPTTFVTGKKGAGKTLRAMKMLEKEMRTTTRTVVTNFPIRYERFREYLIEKHGQDFDYAKRLLMIDTAQTAHFWLYYGVESVVYQSFEELTPEQQEIERKRATRAKEECEGRYVFNALKVEGRKLAFEANDGDHEQGKKGTKTFVPDFACRRGHRSVAYFIDEVHLTFNSRKWTRTGEDCLYYISLERHFGDDQVFGTQCFGNVDKQLREMGQEYIVCTNQKKMPMPGTFGLIRRPGCFTASHYSDPVTTGSQAPMTSYAFGLDKDGIASCYRTVAGAEFGLDDDADKAVKPRGKLNALFLIPLAVAVMFLVLKVPAWAATGFIGGMSKRGEKAAREAVGEVHVGSTNDPGTKGAVAYVSAIKASPVLAPASDSGPVGKVTPVFFSGSAFIRGKLVVILSDGRSWAQGDPDFPLLLKDAFNRTIGVSYRGQQFRFMTETKPVKQT